MFKFTLSKRVQSLVGSEDRSFSLQTHPLKWRTQTPNEYTLFLLFSTHTLGFFLLISTKKHKASIIFARPLIFSLPPFFAPEPTIQLCSETKNGYGSMGLQTHHTHPRTSLHNRLNRRPPRETPVKTPLRTYQKKTTWSITVNIPW